MQARAAAIGAGAERGCVCVDGRLLAPEQARVSAFDAGLLLGDGLFESLRVDGGVPYLLDRHLERLLSAAHELRLAGAPSRPELSAQILRTLEHAQLPSAYVRVTITRGSSLRALAAPSGPPTVIVAALPAPPLSTQPVSTALVGPPAAVGLGAKSISRQHAVLTRMAVEQGGAQEGLYVSAAGCVLEGISSNLFVCRGGALLTPPVEECLPGITRGRVLELVRGAGLSAIEQPVASDVLLDADAAFITNAVQGLRAIGAIDGRPLRAQGQDRLLAAVLDLYARDRAQSAARKAAAGRATRRSSRPPAPEL